MPSIIKVKGSSANVTTANTVSDSKLVRIYAAANTLITIADDTPTTLGTFIMPGGSVEYVEKNPTDTITANSSVSCTPVSYNT